jgi:probable rRNA maturation factor
VSVQVDVQLALAAADAGRLPGTDAIQAWANAAVKAAGSGPENGQLSVRIVDVAEITELNTRYRQKSGPTNVLSFPFEAPPGLPAAAAESMLGDVVVCAAVVEQEAEAQGKPVQAHWAHMIVHGVLHLLGYDHIKDAEAEVMEALEIKVLAALGYADPYH